MSSKEIWRDYVVKKYVRARSAVEAVTLSESAPVIEVYDMKDRPEVANTESQSSHAVGFQLSNQETNYRPPS